MEDVLTYTTYGDIRAALGVSEEELEDVTLGLTTYSDGLTLALMDLDTTLPTLYKNAYAVIPAERTTNDKKLLMMTSQFATYHVAWQAGMALPMSAQKVTDGKAAMARFTADPYKETLARLAAELSMARKDLANLLSVLIGSPAVVSNLPTLLVSAARAVDRVTGS